MTKYQIKLYSKERKFINNFLKIIKKNLIFFNIHNKKTKKKKITVLKSPHVNKKAQEQFESRIYSIKLNFMFSESKKYIILLKKIKNFLLPGITIKVVKKIKENQNYFKTNIVSPIKIKYNSNTKKIPCIPQKKLVKTNSSFNIIKKTFVQLKILNYFGKLC